MTRAELENALLNRGFSRNIEGTWASPDHDTTVVLSSGDRAIARRRNGFADTALRYLTDVDRFLDGPEITTSQEARRLARATKLAKARRRSAGSIVEGPPRL